MFEALKKAPAHDEIDLVASSSSSFASGNSSDSSLLFMESNSFEEVTSPSSSSSISSAHGPLNNMSSLFQELPIKRGLSKYYEGKSQSFSSLAKVRSLEDLAKPENPYNKKLKSCRKSYAEKMGDDERRGLLHSSTSSSRASCSSLVGSTKRDNGNNNNNNFISSRPPIPTHRSTSSSTITNQPILLV